MDEWIVVLEYQPQSIHQEMEYDHVHALVEELDTWHSAALFSPERYALQLHVRAIRPADALRRGLEIHDGAVEILGGPRPELARMEVLTGLEFERQWDSPAERAHPGPTATEPGLCADAYWATRALLRASTTEELGRTLVAFVVSIGGQCLPGPPDPLPEQVGIDISLADDEARYAVAERISVPGLIIEHFLPPLVADARMMSTRLGDAPNQPAESGEPSGSAHRPRRTL